MKKMIYSFILLLPLAGPARAQQAELQQLSLNLIKLAQFKQTLSDLKKGYQILSVGYGTIKNLTEGNFSLHQTYLDGLLAVSPAVRKYYKVGDIISNQVLLVREYKYALIRFKEGGWFSPGELQYMGRVYQNLLSRSLDDLEELTTILTSSRLRMSDDERLYAIDRIH